MPEGTTQPRLAFHFGATQVVKDRLKIQAGRFKRPAWIKPGNNLLSRYAHYHGPRVLNGRVRDGNGCDHTGMVAGNINDTRLRV